MTIRSTFLLYTLIVVGGCFATMLSVVVQAPEMFIADPTGLAAIATAFLMIALGLAALIGRWTGAPFSQLAAEARRAVSSEDVGLALPDTGPQEMKKLSAAVADLIAEVQRLRVMLAQD